MDYGDNTMAHAVVTEKQFAEFFHNVKAALREATLESNQKWDDDAINLQKALAATQRTVDQALKEDFNTPAAINALTDLVKQTNVYMEGNDDVAAFVLRNVSTYVTRMFRVFVLMFTFSVGLMVVGKSLVCGRGQKKGKVF